MKKARTTHSIGLAGGVLSLAGLCLGIVSLGKKGQQTARSAPARSVRPQSDIEPYVEQPDFAEPQFAPLEAPETEWEVNCSSEITSANDCIVPMSEPVMREASEERLSSEKSVKAELTPAESVGERRPLRQAIASLARNGESPLSIAQSLGISIGEVQLTLRLQGLSASAGRRQ